MLTLSWALPLAGAMLLLLSATPTGGATALIRWLALACLARRRSRVTLALWAGFDSASRRVPVRRARAVDSGVRHRLLRRHRRHQPAAGRAHRVPDADCAALVVGGRREEGEGVLDLHPRARGGDDRRLRLARPLPLLRVLGRDAHPDVLPHRDLGLRPAHLRRRQVHALHDGGQRADARRHPRPGVPAQRGDRQLQLRSAEAVHAATSRRRPSAGSSSRSRSRSRSRCRCSRSTPGCPMRTCRRRPPARSSWPACC